MVQELIGLLFLSPDLTSGVASFLKPLLAVFGQDRANETASQRPTRSRIFKTFQLLSRIEMRLGRFQDAQRRPHGFQQEPTGACALVQGSQ
jgi:hypothetical protein